jgi:trehalose 2-sulfotransferase
VSLGYVICASPRSGSTLLCKGLTHTGRAGAPAEFFDHRADVAAYWKHRYAVSEGSDFIDKIVEATSTSNGVFGTKLHWTSRIALVRAVRESLTRRGVEVGHQSMDDLLMAKFSTVRYVWLRRRNKAAQGISHFRADRSDLWELPRRQCRRMNANERVVDFEFRRIDECITQATEYDQAWGAYFSKHRLTPLQVVYEQFVADYDLTLRRVLDFLDIPHTDLPLAEPQLERLADAQSLEWEERYWKIRTGRGSPESGDRAADRPSQRRDPSRPVRDMPSREPA